MIFDKICCFEVALKLQNGRLLKTIVYFELTVENILLKLHNENFCELPFMSERIEISKKSQIVE